MTVFHEETIIALRHPRNIFPYKHTYTHTHPTYIGAGTSILLTSFLATTKMKAEWNFIVMRVDLLSMFLTIKHHEGKKLDISELDLKNFLLVTVELQRANTCEKHLG